MKKSERISTFVAQLGAGEDAALDPRYRGYFACFNAQQYYEAHDVLEHLWLETEGENYAFFKGLIQVAGAFVHLQKQYLRPGHPTDGRRLHPATRLFRLGARNLQPYQPVHWRLDVDGLRGWCGELADAIEASSFQINPWNPLHPPALHLLPARE